MLPFFKPKKKTSFNISPRSKSRLITPASIRKNLPTRNIGLADKDVANGSEKKVPGEIFGRFLRSFRETDSKVFFRDHWHLLIKSAAENQLRIRQSKQKIVDGEVCNLNFNSFTELKRYQKKVRIFTYSFSSTLVSALVLVFVMQIFFLGKSSQGATVLFQQTDWSGGTSTSAPFPKDPDNKSNNWTKYYSGAGVDNAAAGSVKLSYTNDAPIMESFTATTNKDAANTTANWNTAAGQVEPTAEPDATNLKSKLAGFLSGSDYFAAAFADGGLIFYGGSGGEFVKYETATDVATNLTSNVSAIVGTNSITALQYDSVSGFVYFGTATGKLVKYKVSDNTVTNLTSGISGFWSTVNINRLTLDKTNSVIYFGSTTGKFAKCTAAGIGTDLTAKVSAFWGTNTIQSMGWDSVNGAVYLSGNGRTFARYNIGADTADDLAPVIQSVYSASSELWHLLVDANHGAVYLISWNGSSELFARYNMPSYSSGTPGYSAIYPSANQIYSLQAKLDPIWALPYRIPYAGLAFDAVNNVIYMGGQSVYSSIYLRYNTTAYNSGGAGSDTATNVTSSVTNNVFIALNPGLSVFDSTQKTVYFTAGSRKIVRYNTAEATTTTNYPVANNSYDVLGIGGIGWATQVNDFERGGDWVYMTGAGCRFARYNVVTKVVQDFSARLKFCEGGDNFGIMEMGGNNNDVIYLRLGRYDYGYGIVRFNLPEYTTDTSGGRYPAAGTGYALGSKFPNLSMNGAAITSMKYDKNSKALYVSYYSGSNNYLYRYNTAEYVGDGTSTYPTADTAYNLTGLLPASATFDSMALDESNKVLYFSYNNASLGKLYRYNLTNYTAGGTYGTANTAYNLTGKLSAVSRIGMLEFDQANKILYTGNGAALTRYNTTFYSGGGPYPAADNAYSLDTKITGMTNSGISSLSLMNDKLYFNGYSGALGYYRLSPSGSDFAVNLRSPDKASFLGTNRIVSMIGNGGVLLFGTDSSNFILGEKVEKPTSQTVQTLKLNATTYNIFNVKLTKSDTPGMGAVIYYVSNNGGTSWMQVAPGSDNAFATGGNDLRFKAVITDDATIQDVTLNYWSYNSSGALVSSPYNTNDPNNMLAKLQWTADTSLANTGVKFQVRTAPDNAGAPGVWSPWMGPSGDNSSYFTDPIGTQAMPLAVSDVDQDQWIQYQAFLTSDGKYTPTLQDTAMTYVINMAPDGQFRSVISQAADGTITIPYNVRDRDTSTGATNGSVVATLQYCTDMTGTCANPSDWTDVTTATGDLGAVAVAASANPYDNTPYVDTYQINWNPKNEYAQRYNQNFKIRVKLYDGEGANAYGYITSATFELDTKDPIFKTNDPLKFDRLTNKLTIQKPDSGSTLDNTAFDVYLKNLPANGDCTTIVEGDKQTNLAAATTFPRDFDFTIPSTDPDSRKICVRIKDAKGNIANKEMATPSPPANVKFYDFSQIDPADSDPAKNVYTELIVWDVYDNANGDFTKYEVYRAEKDKTWVEANPAGVPAQNEFQKLAHANATITNPDTNYFFDKFYDKDNAGKIAMHNLDKYYFYKIVVTDTISSVSYLSSPRVTDIPDGQGGTDTKAPSITVDPVTKKDVSWVTLDIHFDEISSATVYYSEDNSFDKNVTDPSYTKDHAITIPGLKKNTTYNIKVTALDPANNSAQQLTTVSTNNGPQISNVTFDKNSNVEATIFWATDTDSDSTVTYAPTKNTNGDALVNPIVENDTNATKTHRVTIKNLTPGVKYYFQVASNDGTNTATDANGGEFFEILTTVDYNAPEITNIDTPLISYNSAAVSWTTSIQPTTGKVLYRKSSDSAWLSTVDTYTYDSSHYVLLGDLESDTEYTFKITAKNINGEATTSTEQTFKTTKDPSFDHAPLTSITFSDPNPAVLTDTDAVISFNTDQPASCFVEYGATSGSYDAVPVKEDKADFNKSHSLHLLGLIFQNKYFYKVTCEDNLKTTVSSEEKDFTTKEKMLTGAQWGAANGGDIVPPVISNVRVASVTGESTTITWETDEKGSSNVKFGTESGYSNMAGDGNVNMDEANYATVHSVTIPNLIPGTKYLFTVSSTDAAGNIAQSTEADFTTASPSSLSSIKAESKALGEATISWQTDKNTTSIVEYGLTTSYGEKKESNSFATDHSISLSNLNQGTTYHYRVKGKDENSNLYASADQTFEPKSPPQITNIDINDVTEHGAKITFQTNVPTDAEVTYTDLANQTQTGSQGVRDLATDHEVTLKDLSQGTTFGITISAKDEQGTQSELKGPDFTTGKDENPPKIDQVRTDSALTQSDKVQTIINWKTDEQATTALVYKESRGGEEKEVKITDNLTTGHVAVITTFKAGAVYYFKVKSIDASGNTALSNEFALLTPKRKENIIQVIINNFQEIFGWARR